MGISSVSKTDVIGTGLMSKLNVEPFLAELMGDFRNRKDEGVRTTKTALAKRGVLSSGMAGLAIKEIITSSFSDSFQNVLGRFESSLKDLTNNKALKACDDFLNGCHRALDAQAETYINTELKKLGLAEQNMPRAESDSRYEITASVKDSTRAKINIIKAHISARKNPLWENPWVKAAIYITLPIVGYLGGVFRSSLNSFLFGEKQPSASSMSSEQSVEKIAPNDKVLQSEQNQPSLPVSPTSFPDSSPSQAQPSPAPESNPVQNQQSPQQH